MDKKKKKKTEKSVFVSAKDIYQVNKYSPLKGLSNKEKSQEKAVQWSNNFTNAVNMMFNSLEADKTRKFNAGEAQKARDFNSAEALASRNWQEQMSNTSHQREVKDLIQAGLNPHLSQNTGAQSYTTNAASIGSGASSQNASVNLSSAAQAMASYGGAYQSALASKYAADRHLEAAQAQSAAQIESARIQAEAQRDVAEKAYASSWPGFLYKAIDGAVDYMNGKETGNAINKLMWSINKGIEDAKQSNPPAWKDLTQKIETGEVKTVEDLMKSEKDLMEIALNKLGPTANAQVINGFINAMRTGDPYDVLKLVDDFVRNQQKKGRLKGVNVGSSKSSGRGSRGFRRDNR